MDKTANKIDPIDIFPWNEHFLTGFPEIDQQHRQLVVLLNRLAGHVAYSGTNEQLGQILEELKDYTVYHFNAEEEIWSHHFADDPDERIHKEVHRSFVRTIENIEAERAQKTADVLIQDTLGFLAKWLASHILETDKRMAFAAQGIQAGLSIDAAKSYAEQKMSGETRALIDLILSTYGTLATNAVHLMRELHAHKQANAALQSSERRYHATIDASPVPIAINDDQGHIIYLNRAFSEIFGYTIDDIPLLMDWWGLAYPDQNYREWVISSWGEHLNECLRKNQTFVPMEVVIRSKSGAELTVLATASALDGVLNGQHLVTLFDITERKKIEMSLRESEERYRSLVEATAQIVWICDQNGCVHEDSPSWRAYTGQSYEQWSGYGYVEAIHPDDRGHVIETWRQALKEAWPTVSNIYRLWHTSGEWRWNKATAAPIKNKDGQITAWIGTCSDIHEFHLNQLELDQHRQHLEDLVVSRTADLEIAKEAAEAASRAKTAFLSIASHELRTPMNGIMGTIELAKRLATDQRQIGYLNMASRASTQLLGIINDVLDISRIESARLTLATENFTLDEIRTHVLDAVESIAISKGLTLDYPSEPERDQQLLAGDPVRIAQILINLVGNALKFTDMGGVSIRVFELTASGTNAIRLRFEVSDTGIGIDRSDQTRIFEPFEQVDASTTRRHGGTGLGLPLCKKIVEAMNGRIGLESEIGKGSLFWIELDLEKSTNLETHNPNDPGPGDELMSHYRGVNILLVEDEPINQEVARLLLEEVGLNVYTAADGVEAVDSAKAGKFDLILMDINMPNLGGVEATIAIRRMAAYTKTPIVALTANAFLEDRDAYIRAGMNDHLSKPFTPESLYRSVLGWLKECKGRK